MAYSAGARLVIVALLLMTVGVVEAKDWYVSVDGNNANDGFSLVTPKQNFSNSAWFNNSGTNVSNRVLPGDTVYVIGYFGNGTAMTWYNQSILITNTAGNINYVTGNATHYLIIKAYNGTPTFDGVDKASGKYGIYAYGSGTGVSNISIDGLTVQNQDTNVFFRNLSYIDFRNNVLGDSRTNSNDMTMIDVRESYLYNDTYIAGGYNSLQLQSSVYNVTNITIESSTFYSNLKHGSLDFYQFGNAPIGIDGVYIRNSTIHDTGTWAVFFMHTQTNSNKVFEHIIVENMTLYNIPSAQVLSLNLLNNSYFGNITVWNSTNIFDSIESSSSWQNITIRGVNSWDVTTPTTITANTSREPDVHFVSNNISEYRVYNKPLWVQDPWVSYSFRVRSVTNGSVNLSFTSGTVISENGANITRYYQDRSEYITTGNENVTITPYNITIKPSTSNVTATNTTSNLDINQQNYTIGHIYVNFSAPIPLMNISISNVSSGTNLSLRYAGNDTEIASYAVGVNLTAYFNNSLGNDNYNLTQNASQSTPATFTPPTPANLANTTGNFWVNYTWSAGAGNMTDSFNLSQNGTWTNGSANTYFNATVGAGNWSNITVFAWNSSGTGTLSTSSVSQNTQAPSAFTPSNVTISCPVGWCYLAMNYSSRTLQQLDDGLSTDTVQGWYNSTSQKYESHRTGFSFNGNVNVAQKNGYYYYFSTATAVPVNISSNPSITLRPGWNLVGNMDSARTLADLKTSVGAAATQARHYNINSQSWISSDSENVPVGEAFFVYVTAQTAWSG